MRVLLLGGSGLLSGAARTAFLTAGHDVTVLTRGRRSLAAAVGLHEVHGDRTDAAALARVLAAQRFDFTVDFLGFEGDDVRRLFAVPDFSPGRLAMISTGQVYLVTRDPRPPFREADADAPTMAEPAHDSRAWHNWVYGMGKRRAESALVQEGASRGVPVLALRCPVVQGEADGTSSQRLWGWLERMRDGGPVLLPEGGVQSVRFVYSGDVARALVRLAEGTGWPGVPALNLAQPDEEPLRAFLDRLARLAGLAPRFVTVTAAELEAAGLDDTCAPYWGPWCSRPDPAAAFEALGFRTSGPEEYLPGVVRAHLTDPPPESHPGYAHRSSELALAARIAG